MGATAWFAIELPTAGPPLTVDTFGSNFSTALAVYTPAPLSPPGGLAPLGCNATPAGSTISFAPAGPGAYYIQAGGAGGASGSLTLNVRCTHDLDCDGLSDSDEAALGTSPTVADSDGDGLSDGAEVHIYGSDPLATDTDGDHCGDGREIPLGLDPTNKWDFYSVPVPALNVAPNPVGEVPDKVVSAGDAQAVFAYFKVGAVAGSQVYEQDLNQNGIKDGLEYDRTSAGAPRSGPPDGAIGAVDAQIAFAQFRAGFAC